MDFEILDFFRMLSPVPQLSLTERTVSTVQGVYSRTFFSSGTCKTEFHYERSTSCHPLLSFPLPLFLTLSLSLFLCPSPSYIILYKLSRIQKWDISAYIRAKNLLKQIKCKMTNIVFRMGVNEACEKNPELSVLYFLWFLTFLSLILLKIKCKQNLILLNES